jgi:hypothetical protein
MAVGEVHFLFFSYYYQYLFIARHVQKNTQVDSTCHYVYTYSYFIPCTEFQVATMQTQFCQRSPHRMKG